MSNPQNINQVNINKSNGQNYFNNFYINLTTVSGNQNDALVGYFEDQTNGNTGAAQVLASAIVATSIAQGIDPMQTLQQFVQLPKGELNVFLATFLNLNRVGTSYLGVRNAPIINKYIQRAILA
jgi:hypothetical protein